MTSKILILCGAVLSLAGAASAAPTVVIDPGAISLSASAHSIRQGAAAHSQIYEAYLGAAQGVTIAAEVARISDEAGRSDIGSVRFQRLIAPAAPGRLSAAAYAGVTWLAVKDRFGDRSEESGPSVGALADLPVRPDLAFYARAGVAFLDERLWTLDFGLRCQLRPRWSLSLGYRSYDVRGSSLGGFLIGAAYRISK